MSFAKTPEPPYYAVMFTTERTGKNEDEYQDLNNQLMELVKDQPGFLGIESANSGIGISVSYWDSLEAIKNWRSNQLHRQAQQAGKSIFYKRYSLRIAKVERDYFFSLSEN